MRPLATLGRQAFAALLCMSLIVWSVMPAATHAPAVFETIQDHLEMIDDHGHSHGLKEDLYWAIHGHSHDVADHDHTQAFLSANDRLSASTGYGDAWHFKASPGGEHFPFRIERPPRA